MDNKTLANLLWKKVDDLCEKEMAKINLSKSFEFKTPRHSYSGPLERIAKFGE